MGRPRLREPARAAGLTIGRHASGVRRQHERSEEDEGLERAVRRAARPASGISSSKASRLPNASRISVRDHGYCADVDPEFIRERG